MSLYKRPLDSILDAIKRLNGGVVLAENQYVFGAPQVIDTTPAGDNTSMAITALNSSTPYEGSTTVTYRRLNLADLESLIPTVVKASNITTTLGLALVLNQYYGFLFTAEDIEDTPITLVEGSGPVTLTAKATSRGWVGQANFTVEAGRFSIAQYLLVTALPGLQYPNRDITKPYGEMYSYWRNFSSQYQTLQPIDAGSPQPGALGNIAAALQAISGDVWSITEAKRYSLLGAVIEYNGLTTGQVQANQAFQYVLVLTLHATNSLGLSGRLFIHYNLPDTEFD